MMAAERPRRPICARWSSGSWPAGARGPAGRERVLALLHPDFLEHGASGQVWDRESVSAVTSGPTPRSRRPTCRPGTSGRTPCWSPTGRASRSARRCAARLARDADAGWLLPSSPEGTARAARRRSPSRRTTPPPAGPPGPGRRDARDGAGYPERCRRASGRGVVIPLAPGGGPPDPAAVAAARCPEPRRGAEAPVQRPGRPRAPRASSRRAGWKPMRCRIGRLVGSASTCR